MDNYSYYYPYYTPDSPCHIRGPRKSPIRRPPRPEPRPPSRYDGYW